MLTVRMRYVCVRILDLYVFVCMRSRCVYCCSLDSMFFHVILTFDLKGILQKSFQYLVFRGFSLLCCWCYKLWLLLLYFLFVVVYIKDRYIYIEYIVITFCLEHFVFITLFGCNEQWGDWQ